jgi:hypothetical protein
MIVRPRVFGVSRVLRSRGVISMDTKHSGSAGGYHREETRRPRSGWPRRPRGWGVVAAVAVALGSAVGLMVVEAGTALAPEPVVTTQSLSGTNGALADAVYLNSGTPTRVIKWYPMFVYAPSLAAGTPCSVSALPADATARYVIVAYGNYKECD